MTSNRRRRSRRRLCHFHDGVFDLLPVSHLSPAGVTYAHLALLGLGHDLRLDLFSDVIGRIGIGDSDVYKLVLYYMYA